MEYWIAGFVFLAIMAYEFYKYQRTKQAWSSFAMNNDLTYKPGGILSNFRVDGTYRGHDIAVYVEKRGSSKNRRTYTVYETRLSTDIPAGLELYDESLFSKLGKIFGGEDIQVGRSRLDGAFIIKGMNPEAICRFLDDDRVERALIDLHSFESDVEIEHGKLKIEHRRVSRDIHRIETYLGELLDCADVVDERTADYDRTSHLDSETTEEAGFEEAEENRDEEIDYVAEW